jgi:hypothetical protein
MSPMTHALISYWQRLPDDSAATRRSRLADTCENLREGCASPQDLVPFALGDVDDAIVGAATTAYLDAAGAEPGARQAAIGDAVEWIRRGLAINRGAVFGALLGAGGTAACERLSALRLVLSDTEVATVCRLLPRERSRATTRFLHQWLELLAGSAEGDLSRQHALLSAALPANRRRAA